MARQSEIEDGWQAEVMAAWVKLAQDRLGPAIAGDAKRYAPKRTGALAESIESHMDGDSLVVSATGSGERDYAAWVELGHRVYHPSTGRVGPEVVPPEPFLRPALYRQRSE